MTRLDQLSDSREIAQIGSVLGRQFTYELIEAVAQRSEEGLQKDLSKLVAGELLYQKGSGRAATYLFKHALIQDAAYESLLKRRRSEPDELQISKICGVYHNADIGDAGLWPIWRPARG